MSSYVSRLFQPLAPLFRPPFEGLWLLVVLYYGWCFLVFPHSQILRGNLPDPDDYMYLTQVTDWLNGQAWFDNIQHRLNPPLGVPIHFSRLAQLPMAAFILLFKMCGLPSRGAATLTALLYPLFLLSGLLLAMRALALHFVPKSWAGVSAYICLFSTGLMYLFMPGHVDHHGLIVLIVTLSLIAALGMMKKPDNPYFAIMAGLLLAFGLAVALEILPWLLLISIFLGLWAAKNSGKAALSGLVFGLTLYLASFAFLVFTRPFTDFMAPDVLTYSIVYVMLTGGIAVTFAGLAASGSQKIVVRFLCGASLALISGFLFLHHFPELIAGPYGGMDPELAQMMLGEIDEAKPLINIEASLLGVATHVAGAFLALFASIYFFWRAPAKERWKWGLMLTLLAAALLLTLFYQFRFMGCLGMMSVIPLTVSLYRGWEWIGFNYRGRKKVFAEIFLLLLVGPLPSVLFPALIDGRSFNVGIFLFPVDSSVARTPCDTYVLEKILNSPNLYGDRPRLIMSNMGQGPELLFRTKHMVLSAPYHMDVTGNIDTTRFFSTPYVSEAEAIARRRHVDLIVACRYVPDFYTRAPQNLHEAKGQVVGQDFSPHFIELLMTGGAPSWLKPVRFRGLSNFVIYEVAPAKSGTP